MSIAVSDMCPLCEAADGHPIHRDCHRKYLFCRTCKLVYVPRSHFLSAEEEKQRYDMHINHPQDRGYRRFLSRLFGPMEKILPPGGRGLDFGSGPGPTLSVMFEEKGHSMAVYDRFYAPDPLVFEETYDFITATEVLEHLHHPRQELHRLWGCLKPGGWLGVMTQLVWGLDRFVRWNYIRDPTHVRFYSRATARWIADQWDARLIFVDRDAFLFQKPSGTRDDKRGRE